MRNVKHGIRLLLPAVLIVLSGAAAIAHAAGGSAGFGTALPTLPVIQRPALTPPDAPDSLEVPDSALTRSSVVLRARATDPDGDSIYIRFYYDLSGDTNWHSIWRGPVRSGRFVADTTRYDSAYTYEVAAIARARDTLSPMSASKLIAVFRVGVAWRYPPPGGDEAGGVFSYSPALVDLGGGKLRAIAAAGYESTYAFTDSMSARPRVLRKCIDNNETPSPNAAPSLSSDNSHVYYTADNFRLYYLNAANLNTVSRWPEPYDSVQEEFATPAVNGNTNQIYVGRGDSLICLQDNGSGLSYFASYNAHSRIATEAAINLAGDHIYFGTEDSNFFCLDGTLREIWKCRTGGTVSSDIAIDGSGEVYVGRADGRLYGYAPGAGAGDTVPLYTTTANPTWLVIGSPVVDPDGRIYLVRINATVEAYAGGTGGLNQPPLWAAQPISNTECSAAPCLAPDSTIIVHTSDDQVFALHLADGSLKWELQLPGTARSGPAFPFVTRSSPAIGPDSRRVYVGADNYGFFYAIQADFPAFAGATYLAGAPWPKYQHDNSNSGWQGGGFTGISTRDVAPLRVLASRGVQLAASPSPFSGRTVIGWKLVRPGPASLTIYDATGRSVRELVPPHGRLPVQASVTWDGTDQSGRPVGAGLYFCRFVTADGTACRALILTR